MDELILRSLRGEASDIEERQLRAWRNESPEHEHRYRELLAVWRLSESADGLRTSPSAPPDASLLRARAERRRRQSRWSGGVRRVLGAGGWVAAGAILFVAASRLAGPKTDPVPEATVEVASTEARTVDLPDGSVMRLAPGVRGSYRETRSGRLVELDGDGGFFAVAHTGEPFRVKLGPMTVRVLGTRFEVVTGERERRLVVLDGRVDVELDGVRLEVGSDQRGVFPEGGAPRLETVDDALGALRWRDGLLVFRDTPLSRVVSEVRRTLGGRIELDPSLADVGISARFEDESFHDVASAICVVAGACCEVGDSIASIGTR